MIAPGAPGAPDGPGAPAAPELVLHVGNRRYSSWSLRPYLALAATGAPFRTEVILLDRPETRRELLAVNPAGRVPVLHHGPLVVHDSLAICEYVHELFPAAGLWPADRADRARARAITAEMHAGFAALRGAMSMDLLGHRPGHGHTPEALADARRVLEVWRDARARATGGPFLFGTFTIADAFYAPVATRFLTYGVPLDEVGRAYVAAVTALPAFVAWREAARAEPELPGH
ncbi:MAG: glutathione S-transferase family protein [Kofleriaceae bacterium]|nr:glutathione S-transferase family protein [Kofleriaceae bacterium]MCL4228338.1 glutathione S-transferase family protein [Myxococcales bacterium]